MGSGKGQDSDNTDYSSGGEANDDKEENKKDGPSTPYSLRRTKQPPTRYGADAADKDNSKPHTHKSPKPNMKQTSPVSTSSNRSRSSSKERGQESDEENNEDNNEKKAYSLRPRSQISYKEPDNLDFQTLERRHSSHSSSHTPSSRSTKREVYVYVEAESRPGLRPRKIKVKASEVSKYKITETSQRHYDGDASDGDASDEGEKNRSEHERSRTDKSDSASSDSDAERTSPESDGSESERGKSESSGSESDQQSDKGPIHQKSSKEESPKKSEVRRSKRARIVPERYNPLADHAAQPGQGTKPRFPTLPKSWSGGVGGGGGRRRDKGSRHHEQFGYDSDSSSSSSSGDDLPRGLPSLRMGASIPQPLNLPRPTITSTKADTGPVDIDKSVNWESVGGLNYHIQQLKEMILLPLLYPEVFNRFNVTPPKGVLFYGPPGTGKTLMARALANSCSDGGKKVSFFMRKGADCLSKWVGEAERQLRLLFEQARSMQPAIIFFDEIDGLAPVRSSKQDQIHSSIVSTLLALMDGLDNRGSVIVIGATNRLDSIDPALRRPGRFDREFLFTLPGREARREILNIHTRSWQPPVKPELLDELAGMCVGYCGADIKSLCTEAVLVALRHRYPQIYESSEKLKINLDSIFVERPHFVHAMQALTPASHRSALIHAIPLSPAFSPLLENTLAKLVRVAQSLFPVSSLRKTKEDLMAFSPKSSSAALPSALYRPRLLLTGPQGMGQSELGAALLHHLEEFPVFALDIPSLHADPSAKTIEEAAMHVLSEAKRVQPCVLFAPHIDAWFEDQEFLSLRVSLLSFLNDLAPSYPLFLFATSDRPTNPQHPLTKWFNSASIVSCGAPSHESRRQFFAPLLEDILKVQPPPRKRVPLRVLTKAAAPVAPELDESSEEHLLRQFRMVLRDILHKMMDDRRFYFFAKDLNPSQFPEYYQIIRKPVSLSTLLQRCDGCYYTAPSLVYVDLAETLVHNTIVFYSQMDDEHSAQKVISLAKALQDAIIEGIDPAVRAACEAILTKRGRPTSPPRPIITSRPIPTTPTPSMTSPTPTNEPTRRSSARLRGEKPVYKSLEEPPLKRTKTDNEKEDESGDEVERDRQEESDVESQNESRSQGSPSDDDDSVGNVSFSDETPVNEKPTDKETEKESTPTVSTTTTSSTTTTTTTTTSSDTDVLHRSSSKTYLEKEIVVIGDPDPSVLLAMLKRNTKLPNGKEKLSEVESENVSKKRVWDDIEETTQKKKSVSSPSSPPSTRSSKPNFFIPSNTTTSSFTNPSSPHTPILSPTNNNSPNPQHDSENEDDSNNNRNINHNNKKQPTKKASKKPIIPDDENDTEESDGEKNINSLKNNNNTKYNNINNKNNNKITTPTTPTENNKSDDEQSEKEKEKDVEMREEEEEVVEEEEEVIQPIIDKTKAEGIVREMVNKTERYSVEELIEVHAKAYSCLHRHHSLPDKSDLLKELSGIVATLKTL